MVYHDRLLLPFLKYLILKLRDVGGLAPWVKRKKGKKIQTNMLPCVSLTFAGSSIMHSTIPGCKHRHRGPHAVAFPGKSAFSTQRSLQNFPCLERVILDFVLSSPENLEPFSLLSH